MKISNTGWFSFRWEIILTPFLQLQANGAAGRRGLTAPSLVGEVDRVEVVSAATKSREKLSRMAGVLENESRRKYVLIGNAQVHSPII